MEQFDAKMELQELSQDGVDGEGGVSQANKTETLKRRAFEEFLRRTIKEGSFHRISDELTPRALTKCDKNALLMAMEVNFTLHRLANRKGPEEEDLTKLANSVDEFTTSLLDPLKCDTEQRELFRGCMDEVIDTAIELEQKKFFTHPVITNLMNDKWYGRLGRIWTPSWLSLRRLKWLCLDIWCLFDLVLFPVVFAVLYLSHLVHKKLTGRKGAGRNYLYESYLEYFTTPYFIFVRDTLGYLLLLGLHFAICLEPSSIAFSGLEWTIMVFFMGRIVVEGRQFWDINVPVEEAEEFETKVPLEFDDAVISEAAQLEELVQVNGKAEVGMMKGRRSTYCGNAKPALLLKKLHRYLSDRWNVVDFITVLVYVSTFLLRIVTWLSSESVTSNRALVVAGFFYGLNTMFLTLRAFGHVMETLKDVGTIQIALFQIIGDVVTILWQFIATILAFSITLTKLFMAEKSYVTDETNGKNLACGKSGISCWWTIVKYLGWSLLGIADLGPLDSVDDPTMTLAHFLYGAFLIMGVILLINMMIALLSNTYQRVADNSFKEWSFKKAVTVQTYSVYHPIPVPLNLLSNLALALWYLWQKCRGNCTSQTRRTKSTTRGHRHMLDNIVNSLQLSYFATHGYSFPLTDERKIDQLLLETERNRQMSNQIAQRTFRSHDYDQDGLPTGPKTWHSIGISVEGCLLVYEGPEYCDLCKSRPPTLPTIWYHSARYTVPFSEEFPHFEVLIQEIGNMRFLDVGVVRKGHEGHCRPGRYSGSVAFHADGDKGIADAGSCLEIEHITVACRGDLIGCTALFGMAADGKVPIVFTLNGSLLTGGDILMEYDHSEKLMYPFIGMGEAGVRVLARMSASHSIDHRVLQHGRDDNCQCNDVTLNLPEKKQWSMQGKVASTAEDKMVTIHRELDQASREFRRLREEMFANFRMFEDLFNDWHRECLKVSSFALQQNGLECERQLEHDKYKQKLTDSDLLKKIKENITELGEMTSEKCGVVFNNVAEIRGAAK